MKMPMRLLYAVFTASLAQVVSASDALDNWEWRYPLPQGHSLNDAAYGNGVFVAVGDGGTLLTSADGGTNWTVVLPGTDPLVVLNDVIYANSQFVAVGQTGANYRPLVLVSADGASWNSQEIPTNGVPLRAAAYGNGVYVAVSDNSTLVSADATNWTVHSTGGGVDVAFGNGLFAAIKRNVTKGLVQTSANGIDWTVQRSDIVQALSRVVYGNDRFVAVGNNVAAESPDGVTWNDRLLLGTFPALAVAFGNGIFTATGVYAWTSSDGTNWIARDFGISAAGNSLGVTYGGGVFVSVGANGELWTSDDAISWTRRSGAFGGPPTTFSPMTDIAYGNGMYAAVAGTTFGGGVQGGGLYISNNGQDWNHFLSPSGFDPDLHAVTFGQNILVAVGRRFSSSSDPIVITSSDGVGFSEHILSGFGQLNDVIFDGDQFVTVGAGNGIFTSYDATNWTSQASGTSGSLISVAHGNGVYVAVGSVIITSNNGTNWMDATPGTTYSLSSVAFGNGTFVAAGFSSLLTSPNGTVWTPQSSEGGEAFSSVVFVNDQFVGLGRRVVQSSPDGVTWTRHEAGTVSTLNGIAYDGSTYVVVGQNRLAEGQVIRQSAPSGTPLAPTLAVKQTGTPNQFKLIIMGEANQNYRIWYSQQLPPDWQVLDDIQSTSANHEYLDAVPSDEVERYWRVGVNSSP